MSLDISGLCNAPSTFKRLMNKAFAQNVNSVILMYLEDILILSRCVRENWDNLRRPVDKFREGTLFGRLYESEYLT